MGGKPRPRLDDSGVSDTLGVVLMLAISVAMAGALYVWVFGVGFLGEDAGALSVTSNGAYSPVTENKAYTVAGAAGGFLWNDLLIKVDGELLTYDDTLTGSNKFCVSTSTGSCVPAATWQASATPVAAGHILTIHDASLAGKKLQIIDGQAGVMLLLVPI